MMTVRQILMASAITVLLALLAWITVSPGTPRIYAPINLSVWVPVGVALNLLDLVQARLSHAYWVIRFALLLELLSFRLSSGYGATLSSTASQRSPFVPSFSFFVWWVCPSFGWPLGTEMAFNIRVLATS